MSARVKIWIGLATVSFFIGVASIILSLPTGPIPYWHIALVIFGISVAMYGVDTANLLEGEAHNHKAICELREAGVKENNELQKILEEMRLEKDTYHRLAENLLEGDMATVILQLRAILFDAASIANVSFQNGLGARVISSTDELEQALKEQEQHFAEQERLRVQFAEKVDLRRKCFWELRDQLGILRDKGALPDVVIHGTSYKAYLPENLEENYWPEAQKKREIEKRLLEGKEVVYEREEVSG